MAEIVLEVVGRVAVELLGAVVLGAARSAIQQARSNNSNSSSQQCDHSLPQLSVSSKHQKHRAVLISSSNISFGNDCERLVNIAFETSQSFPTLMSTYGDAVQYLQKELSKQYPDVQFHIVIGRNEKFGFFVSEDQYYAEIEHARYRVLIFTTKKNSQIKLDNSNVGSQTLFVWN